MSVVPHVVGMPDEGARRLWRRWLVAVTLGELVGFAIPSIAGGIAWTLDAPAGAQYLVLVAAGAGEGAVLGLAQWLALCERLPWPPGPRGSERRLPPPRSPGAWGCCRARSAIGPRMFRSRSSSPPSGSEAPPSCSRSAPLSASSFGAVCLERGAGWVRTLGWCAGLVVAISFLSALLTEDTRLAGGIVIGVAAGVLMGAVVAAVTGWFLVRILEPR